MQRWKKVAIGAGAAIVLAVGYYAYRKLRARDKPELEYDLQALAEEYKQLGERKKVPLTPQVARAIMDEVLIEALPQLELLSELSRRISRESISDKLSATTLVRQKRRCLH